MAQGINYQYQYKSGTTTAGYVDTSLRILETVSDVTKILSSDRFEGQTVLVKNESCPFELWLVDGTANYNWQLKKLSEFGTYSDLMSFTSGICNTLRTKRVASKAFSLGLEAIVQADEMNENSITKYYVNEIQDTGYPVWKKYEGGGSGILYWEGDDEEPTE